MTVLSRRTTRRQAIAETLAVAGAAALLPASARAEASPPGKLPARTGPKGDIHDFDFYVGTWALKNRRLKKRWVGSNEWDEFPATCRCESRLGGVVNMDELTFPTKGFAGVTMRLFNTEHRLWSAYWINSATGELSLPVYGGFVGDHGELYGEDVDGDRQIQVQFLWTRQGPNAVRWQQAFSLDGRTWETNWVIDHTRVAG